MNFKLISPLKYFVLSSIVLFHLNTLAAPKISDNLKKLIYDSQSIQSDEKFRVLVQFKADQFVDASDIMQKHSVRIQQTLEKNTLRFEQLLLKEINLNHKSADAFTLWIARGTILSLNPDQIRSLISNQTISQMSWLNRRGQLIADHQNRLQFPPSKNYTYGLQIIRVPELLAIYPELTGLGTTVGIIDTGIDPEHPDLKGKIQSFRDFTNLSNKNPRDDHGHGSHVAGTIAGGSTSGLTIGVAPEAKLVIAKSFKGDGSSRDENLLKSLQWMADPDENPATADHPQVISNSWNLDESPYADITPQDEPFCVAIESLSELGILSVFAAGNDGSGAATIKTPGSCPKAITVGATDEKDHVTDFSSRGPVRWKNITLIKPDISAPGRDIESADTGGGYQTRSGTSMATPHIAGILSLMLQVNFDLKAKDITQFLFEGAKDLGSKGIDNLYGFGRADILQTIYLMKQ